MMMPASSFPANFKTYLSAHCLTLVASMLLCATRWMRRTLRAGWGRRGGVTGSSTRGRWGFRNGGDRSRGRFSAGGAGQDDGRVSTMEESSLHAKDDEGNGDGSQGWGLAGWASDGERRWSGKDDSLGELRHPLVTRQTWSSSDDDETRRGGGVDGDDTHGDKVRRTGGLGRDEHGAGQDRAGVMLSRHVRIGAFRRIRI